MLLRVLGTVYADLDDGTQFVPPSEAQRKMLALLALRAGRAVASETICDLFGLTSGAVRTTVSRLRRELGDVLVTEPGGYAVQAETDVQRFQSLVTEAKTASDARATELRLEALELFVAQPLEEFSDEEWAVAEVARLRELRSALIEDQAEADIAAERFDEALDRLHPHIADHPFRDRPRELLMLALALSGRQVEALRSFQDYRTHLVDEVGVDPGPAIVELDRQISVGEIAAGSTVAPVLRPGLRVTEPAPTQSNIYFPANEFVGREAEIAEIGSALAASRLVTLLGPGGVGKTRLAYRVAAEQIDAFADGAWVAELVDCESASTIVRTIADVFGLADVDTAEECAELLAGHDLLLVLDNCEHIVDELVPVVDTLLSRTARLRIVATSRVRLAVVGERLVSIAPMRTDGEAQQLFLRRATDSGAVFEESELVAVGQICERLDGIPLALELAAASSRVLSPAELLDRLEDRFAILKGGPRGSVAGRHGSLRAAVDSSYDSLTPGCRDFFRRISAFAGDFPLDAAEAAAAGLEFDALDLLSELVDRSLLTSQRINGRTRYRLLETLRQYGEDRLSEAGEMEAAIERQLAWSSSYAERLVRNAFGTSESTSLNELVASVPNLRLAINRLLDAGRKDEAVELVVHLEDLSYASHALVGLVAPVVEAGISNDHPQAMRLKAMELTRRATSGSTDTRRELAQELAESLTPDAPGGVQLSTLLIATALGLGPGADHIRGTLEQAERETVSAERARLLAAAGLGTFYGDQLPDDLALVEDTIDAARRAGMKRLTVAAASMACIGGLRLGRPGLGADLARPFLADVEALGQDSIMSNGLISMYTESAIQAERPAAEHLAAIRLVGSTLRGDYNKVGQALARAVLHHGHDRLAIRALGASASGNRSSFSTAQRAEILRLASETLSERDIETLLAAGAVSETTDLYREMWSVLEPLMEDESTP